MALLPSANDMRRETPSPSRGIASYQDGGVGRAVQQLGADVTQMAAREYERIERSRVQDALTQAKKARLDLTLGEEGFTKVNGAGVVNTPNGEQPFAQRYSARYQEALDRIGASITSQRAREEFQRQAAQEHLGYQTDLLRHAANQTEQFHTQADEGALALSAQQVSLYSGDDVRIKQAFAESEGVFTRKRNEHGIAPEKVDAERQKHYSTLHTTVVNERLAGEDFAGAQAYFDKHSKEMFNAEEVGARLTKGTKLAAAQEIGATVARTFMAADKLGVDLSTKTSIYSAIEEALSKDATPEEKAAARHEADTWLAARNADMMNLTANTLTLVDQGKGAAVVKSSAQYNNLDAKSRKLVDDALSSKTEEGKRKAEEWTEEKMTRYTTLMDNPQTLAAMSPEAVMVASRGLTTQMRASLANAHTQLKGSPEKPLEVTADLDMLKTTYHRVLGKDPTDKDQALDFAMARYEAETAIAREQGRLKRTLSYEEKAAAAAEAFRPYATKTWYRGTKLKPAWQLEGETLVPGEVPPGSRQEIRDYLRQRGETPTEERITQMYQRLNTPRK